jgi:hypothetical protein
MALKLFLQDVVRLQLWVRRVFAVKDPPKSYRDIPCERTQERLGDDSGCEQEECVICRRLKVAARTSGRTFSS